jgi:acyl-CoA thioesterase
MLDSSLKQAIEDSGAYKLLGIRIESAVNGEALLAVDFDPKLTQPMGVAHGGVMATLADSAVAIALMGVLKEPHAISTIEMKINYFRPFLQGTMLARARIIQKGRSIAVGEVDITDEHGKALGKALMTYKIS